jgi:NADPH:quinone reductase-like Zn-dependent oxidoreductase
MKAARISGYGEPIRIEEVPVPVAGPGQVLIEVKAASVNPVDWKIAGGYMQAMMQQAMPLTLGCEFAGLVKTAGPGTSFAEGARVYGYTSLMRNGAYAEYVLVEASEIALIPDGLTFSQAAAVPVALFTALDGIVVHGQVEAGERVLVLGGAGGVGMMAVQIAKQEGAFVYATASARNQDRLLELGADAALDYATAKLAEAAPNVDVIFDSVGGEAAQAAVVALRPGGKFVSPTYPQVPAGIDLRTYAIHPDGARLAAFNVASLKIFVDREYPLSQAAEAVDYSKSGRARGKIVLLP